MEDVQTVPPTPERSSRLLGAARSGDWSAYEQLVLHCEQPAFRLAYLILRDASAAAELATRSFLACSVAVESPDDSLALLAGLLRSVIEHAPASRKSPFGVRGVAERRSRPLPPDVAVIHGEQNRLILGAIARLAPADQNILYLRYFLALDCSEAAAVLGCTEHQVRERGARALERMGAEIERRAHSPGEAASALPGLEQRLQATAASFPYPPTAAIAEEARLRLESRREAESPPTPAAPRRRWSILAGIAVAIAVAVVVVLLLLR